MCVFQSLHARTWITCATHFSLTVSTSPKWTWSPLLTHRMRNASKWKQIRKINRDCFILKENWWFNSNYHNVHKNIFILSYQVCSRCCGLHFAENHRGLWGHVFRGTQEKRPRRILGYHSELSHHWPRYMFDDDINNNLNSHSTNHSLIN